MEKRKGEKRGGGERWAKEGREEKKGGKGGVEPHSKKPFETSSQTNVAQKFGKKTPCSFLNAILPKFWAKKIQSLAVRIPGFGGKNSFWRKNAFFGEKTPFFGKKMPFP